MGELNREPAPGSDRPFNVPDYIAFVDESGTGALKGCELEDERFLCLTSLIFRIDYYHDKVVPYVNWIKSAIFGNTNIVLHRNSIIGGRILNEGVFSILNDPEVCSQFERALTRFFGEAHYNACSALIDKQAIRDEYPNWIPDVYDIAMENLVERIRLWFRGRHQRCKLVFEARGKHEDRRLQGAFAKIYHDGTRFIPGGTMREVISSSKIEFHKKAENVVGLQVADLIGTDAKRRILKDHYGRQLRWRFGASLADLLYTRQRYFVNPQTMEIVGYGIVIRPKK